jgi:biopolymer transport protein ExbB
MVEIFRAGGFVMYPMVLLSILTMAIGIERIIYLRKARNDADSFMGVINGFLERNSLDDALKHCETTAGPVASIIKSGLKNQRRGRAEVIRSIEDAGALEVAQLEKGILILQTISKIAPLIGLFGTVTGMIAAFRAIGQAAGGANPANIASGISEALIATASGLVVAIPAYFLSFYFLDRVNKFMLDMQKSSIRFLDALGDLEENIAERSQRFDTVGGDYLEV